MHGGIGRRRFARAALATVLIAQARGIQVRDVEVAESTDNQWEACADEGDPVSYEGPARFGWGEEWIEASLPAGATCNLAAFGAEDPAPGIRKLCECAKQDGGEQSRSKNELGVTWSFCASEGQNCKCDSGLVRFGAGFDAAHAVYEAGKGRWIGNAKPHENAALNCSVASFDGADPAAGSLKECWCMQSGPEPARKQVAIVMVTRHPQELSMWLKYHLGFAGVDHVFIQVEDSPELNESAPLWKELGADFMQRVTVWRSVESASTFLQKKNHLQPLSAGDKRPADDYTTLQKRQVRAMRRAKVDAQRLGISWLIHIDDDELLYTPVHRPVGEIFAAMPDDYSQAYIPNVEAVYQSPAVKDCFAETAEVNINAYKFVGYANGKAAVRIRTKEEEDAEGDDRIEPAGPHQWRTLLGAVPPSIHLDQEPFGTPVMVVHFESCPFARWEDKYWELGNASPEQVASIPFPFYRESIQRMQECRGEDGSRSLLPDCTDEALTHFWGSWKTRQNPDLKNEDIMPIRIPWAAIQAL